MNKKLLLTGLICFVINSGINAQTITVLDKSDLNPIPNISITNQDKSRSAVTNTKGTAELSGFISTDTLTFSHVAYQTLVVTLNQLKLSGYRIYLTDRTIRMDEFVFSANKTSDNINSLPNKIEVVSSRQIMLNNPQATSDLLQQTGMITVQQSQMGGGSPVLRGFEANRVLLVVDGVRMNNAIYRSGHLQNVITIDPFSLGKVEVLFGPGSVVYGSDAIGGVLHFYTLKPELSVNGKALLKSNVFARYSSAANEMAGGVNFSIGSKKWGSFTSIAYKTMDDLKAGTARNPFYGDWGKCLYSSQRIDGKDSMVANPDPEKQLNTGYLQYDLIQKVLYRPGTKSRYMLNLQFSNSGDIPRYDRLTQMDASTGKFKYAEWYYGPQTRLMTSLAAEFDQKFSLADHTSITFAYQNISEDRIQRKFNDVKKEFREETVDVLSLNIDMEKKAGKKIRISYGAEVLMDQVGSAAYAKNIETNVVSYNISTRYPDIGSSMNTVSAYVTNKWEVSRKMVFSQGLRFSFISLRSEYSDTMMKIMQFPFENVIEQKNTAPSGSLGLVYKPGNDWKISLMGSTGFRAPNVDDIAKVNDSKGKSQLLIVPNPELKPEYAYNADLTVSKTILQSVNIEVTGFYTYLDNAIVSKPYLFNGQDSVMYDGYLCEVQASTNADGAIIYGMQFHFLAQLNQALSLRSDLTYTFGEIITENTPLDHIPPVFGKTSLKLELKKFLGEFYVQYNGWKKAEDYSSSGEDNIEYATGYGTPSWYTLNLKASYQINNFLNLQLGIENLLDVHYRTFASGVSAPGRNIILALRAKF
jgi:hemoglobin/transferrin/lactoferrin receptor protein